MAREFRYRWVWDLGASREALWPLVADTNRFNRETGVPPVERAAEGAAPLPAGRRHLRLVRLGLPVEWEEEPFEWVWPERFGVVRRYRRGPVAELRVEVELTPRPEGGTRVAYAVTARPRSVLGRLAIPFEIGVRCARRFEAVVREYDRMARGAAPPLEGPPATALPAGAVERLGAARAALVQRGLTAELIDRLVRTLEGADPLTLARLRPYALADRWGVPRRAVLELCLWATRVGLLDLRWELLCPLCRGAKASHGRLAEVGPAVHCDTCRIDVTVDFDRLVEVTFRPAPAIRPIEDREYCIGGPRVTPHVVVQQLLPPGASRGVAVSLDEGRYRLRVLGRPGGRLVRVAAGGPGAVAVRLDPGSGSRDEVEAGRPASFTFENPTGGEQLVILERVAWTDEAVTAAEVSVLQLFRDLFATEALRPGEGLAVHSLTLVFTDLAGSTRLYREIGDAPAFGRIMSHFDVLRRAIADEGGAIVKTMGDAVMAAFGRPAAALRAMVEAQRVLASPPAGGRPLALKVGIHAGPCLAVTLNDRLDYFGSVVNAAARLESLSTGTDIVVSTAVRDDPEVAAWLGRPGGGLRAEPFQAALKGFDEAPFDLWRLRTGVPPGPGPGPPGSDPVPVVDTRGARSLP